MKRFLNEWSFQIVFAVLFVAAAVSDWLSPVHQVICK